MASAQDIATQLGRIVTCPVEAHADEVNYLVPVWPAISVRRSRLGPWFGCSPISDSSVMAPPKNLLLALETMEDAADYFGYAVGAVDEAEPDDTYSCCV
ncbi:hypothetical protein AURDEDRAFT_177437, partial [Auricularia subglabra TFB-10046 SS5]